MRVNLLRTSLQKLLFKRPQFLFAYDTTHLPKNIRTTSQLTFDEMMYLEREIMYCNNQAKIIAYLDKYQGHINDEHIAQLTVSLVDHQITLDEEFNEKAAPILAHYISMMNKDHSRCFGIILRNLAFLELRSPDIWKAVVEVFYKENMKKYIPVQSLAEAFVFFEKWERPPFKLLNEIAPVLKNHRYRISENYRNLVSDSYERVISNKIEDQSFLNLENVKVEQLDK